MDQRYQLWANVPDTQRLTVEWLKAQLVDEGVDVPDDIALQVERELRRRDGRCSAAVPNFWSTKDSTRFVPCNGVTFSGSETCSRHGGAPDPSIREAQQAEAEARSELRARQRRAAEERAEERAARDENLRMMRERPSRAQVPPPASELLRLPVAQYKALGMVIEACVGLTSTSSG